MSPQSVFDTASRGAQLIGELSWVLLIGGALIFIFVMVLTVRAVWSGPQRIHADRWVLGGGVIFPVVVLTALLLYGFSIGGSLTPHENMQAMQVQVIGKRWWWEVRYTGPDGRSQVITANELHLPVGCNVDLLLTTDNVIHSFWVPALAGKVDMIPGHRNRLMIETHREGTFRGQCAEYCGDQHAQMAFEVVVTSPDAFRSWLERESQPAVEPVNDLLRTGRDAFFRGGCNVCHTIRGTPANGNLGPDLTHVGGRRTLASGILPNHRGTLAGWVADAQSLKPGSLMPSMSVYTGDELRALAAYLESLK